MLKSVSNSSELLATSVQFVTTHPVSSSLHVRALPLSYTQLSMGRVNAVWWWVGRGCQLDRLQKIKLFVIYLDSQVLVKLLAEY